MPVYLPRRKFVEKALECLGYPSTPFLGKDTPVGPYSDMSCSGLICWIADELRLHRPISKFTEKPVRTSREMFLYWGYPVNRGEAEEGDLVFFSKRGTKVSHVGIYLSNGRYLHSPGTKDGRIVISDIDDFEPRYFSDGRYKSFDIVFEQNPVGFNRIF